MKVGVVESPLGILQVVYVAFVLKVLGGVVAPNTSTHLWGQVFRNRAGGGRADWAGWRVDCEVWDLRCLIGCRISHMDRLVPGQSPRPVSLGGDLAFACSTETRATQCWSIET